MVAATHLDRDNGSKKDSADKAKDQPDSQNPSLGASTMRDASLADIRSTHSKGNGASDLPRIVIEDHVVKKGETLSAIAQGDLKKDASTQDIYRHVRELAKLNHLRDSDDIQAGQKIKVFHGEKAPAVQPVKAGNGDKLPANSQDQKHDQNPKPNLKPEAAPVPAPGAGTVPERVPGTDAPKSPAAPATPAPEAGSDLLHKAGAIAGDIASGALDEIKNHPGELLKDAAIGGAIAVGAVLVAPEVALVAGAAGLAVGAYEIAQHVGGWFHAASVVADSEHHTAAEQAAAHETLHGLGAGAAEFAAGAIGGGVAGVGTKAFGSEIAAASKTLGTKVVDLFGRSEGAAEKEGAKSLEGLNPKEKLDVKPEPEVKVTTLEDHPYLRHYEVNGKKYGLSEGDGWYYGMRPLDNNVAPVKVHVSVNGQEDLAKVQKALIPFLNDNPEARNLTHSWKTFDPHAGFKPTGIFDPGPEGQNAKGFTLYTHNVEDARKLQSLVDKELVEKGLSIPKPYDTGNVDIIEGASNRVGTTRDYFAYGKTDSGRYAIKLDQNLAERIEAENGGAPVSKEQLRAIEKETGIRSGSLEYNKNGELLLKPVSSIDPPKKGRFYVDESKAIKTPGKKTDRPAVYALSQYFGINPSDLL